MSDAKWLLIGGIQEQHFREVPDDSFRCFIGYVQPNRQRFAHRAPDLHGSQSGRLRQWAFWGVTVLGQLLSRDPHRSASLASTARSFSRRWGQHWESETSRLPSFVLTLYRFLRSPLDADVYPLGQPSERALQAGGGATELHSCYRK